MKEGSSSRRDDRFALGNDNNNIQHLEDDVTEERLTSSFFTDINRNRVNGISYYHHGSKIYRLYDYYFIRQGDFDIVWRNVYFFVVGHILWAVGLYLLVTQRLLKTWIYCVVLMYIIGTTVGAGAHRLWSHKSYRASNLLKVYLMLGHTLGGHNAIFTWARDHRVHHKFSDTDGDPHNTRRGFFFSHCGWLLRKKHPELRTKASSVQFTDLYADPVLTFQRKNYFPLYFFIGFLIPIGIPVLLWEESWFNSFMVTYAWRLVNTLHGTWFVNSAGHMFGDKPYDQKIKPVENWMVSFGSAGEGYHNYHHTFPYDYATSELGYVHNVTKRFIDLMSFIGLASDLRKPSREAVERQKSKSATQHSIHAFEWS